MASLIKPTVINRGQNHITFSWKDLNKEYILKLLNELKKWIVVYYGEKQQIKLCGLAPCTSYEFLLKRGEEEIEFRAATTEGPFLTMHMTRAVKVGKTALVRKIAHTRPLLLEVENKDMKTPLNQAIEKNDLPMVTLLVTLGANVNTVFYYNKRTPLMYAITCGYLNIANFLIDKGCNVNAIDINGLNILHHAVDSKNLENVKFALKHTLNVDAPDFCGWTPLLRAAILNCGEDIIETLLENGASKEVTDRNGFSFEKHRNLALKIGNRN